MALAMGLIGGAISAIGAVQSAMATAAAAKYNEAVAKRNAQAIAGQTANEMEDANREHRRTLGLIKSSYGQNNLMIEGAPLDVLIDTTEEQAYDIKKIQYKGRMKAQGERERAELFAMEAKSAKVEGFIGAASAFLGGVQSAGTSLLQTG